MDTKKLDKNQADDLALGQSIGVSGTPTFYINGVQLVGAQPYASIKAVIDQELAKK
jgi:protein-disulfide isomerase